MILFKRRYYDLSDDYVENLGRNYHDYDVFVIRKYCVIHKTDKSECGRYHPWKGSIS